VDHEQQTKTSASADAQSEEEERVPGTTPVGAQPQSVVVNGNAMWPTTSPNKVFQFPGDRLWSCEAVLQIVFSNDGKRLAIISECLIDCLS
jgi:hypothetical protein